MSVIDKKMKTDEFKKALKDSDVAARLLEESVAKENFKKDSSLRLFSVKELTLRANLIL